MNWYEVAKYKSSGILWHSTIQLEVLTSLRTGEAKGVREESIHFWKNMDGVALQVLPLDGNIGDNLRLLTASCLCLLALHIQLPAMFVLWQGLLHTRTLSVPSHCTDETFFLRLQTAPCLRVACYHESILLADWLWNGDIPEEWEVGDIPLYCSVVNKKFCIPALSCYF